MSDTPEWTAQDDPATRPASDGDRCCLTCAEFSQWMGQAGDCLLFARRRRDELLAGVPIEERTPSKSARMTAADEVCDGWTSLSVTIVSAARRPNRSAR